MGQARSFSAVGSEHNRINTANNNGDSGTLTIGSGITITGQTGFIGYDGGENQTPLINQGTIDANVGNGAIEVFGSNWSNTGTIGAESGGRIILNDTCRTAERLPTAAAEIDLDGAGADTGRSAGPEARFIWKGR